MFTEMKKSIKCVFHLCNKPTYCLPIRMILIEFFGLFSPISSINSYNLLHIDAYGRRCIKNHVVFKSTHDTQQM